MPDLAYEDPASRQARLAAVLVEPSPHQDALTSGTDPFHTLVRLCLAHRDALLVPGTPTCAQALGEVVALCQSLADAPLPLPTRSRWEEPPPLGEDPVDSRAMVRLRTGWDALPRKPGGHVAWTLALVLQQGQRFRAAYRRVPTRHEMDTGKYGVPSVRVVERYCGSLEDFYRLSQDEARDDGHH